MRRSGMWTFMPPGRARAIATRSWVAKFLKAVRFSSAARNSFLTGGRTATFLIPATYAGIGESGYERRREKAMQIGEPLRTVVVEPLELPVKQPTGEPELVPAPEPQPEQVPISQ